MTRIDITSTARFLLFTQMSSPTATPAAATTSTAIGWVRMANPSFTEAQVQAEVARQMGLSYDNILAILAAFNAGTIASTQDVFAKGNELEVNYVSPSRNLTIAASATSTESIKAHLYVDLIASYRMKLWSDKIGATFRFKCENVQERGRLQAVAAYPDGTPNAYRIVDPRKFVLSATFDL